MTTLPTQRLVWEWADLGHDSEPVASVILNFEFHKWRSKWVGTCTELGTSTYARSKTKTEVALKALVLENLNLLEEAGERSRFFDEWDIRLIIPSSGHVPALPADPEPAPPSPSVEKRHQLAFGFERQLTSVGA